ncbi:MULTISPECIES: helix-turn-helix transcriptional regulator [unclassified Streptomyces]|uniref:helix-turn-helix domain-containing protein n=1 Tax=unclassified Streptomyces TaxID=2593676 RepID=UPI002DDA5415|nr:MULTISPECIES: helix-turn-helix transcriptional regulator [unclassified Streptomyces]WSA94240.1 helix-turn-helix transcriptional regulator [Streptomyces sp. NBC_01795]WSS13139.1 helix-turn-helix transcriptional regulator [Streptomyces sp. NBC_01186]WSS41921.1 helix-turn-helix transcriptional regulator [Streptomyces sp. NBC_01187]
MPARRPVTGRSREPRKRFAEELRARRADNGESLRRLAERMGWDYSLFGKMESGVTIGSPEVVQALDEHYGTGDLLLTLWELASADTSQFREQYREFMGLESKAISIQKFAPSVVPGLLQTEAYARELLLLGGLPPGDELDQQVAARVSRRGLLSREGAPNLRAILDEAVLHHALPDHQEWREQLTNLLVMGERRNVNIQVLPFAAHLREMMNTETSFLVSPDCHTVAWVETGYDGQLVTHTSGVDELHGRYDRLRDYALSPRESAEFIAHILEEVPCPSPEST